MTTFAQLLDPVPVVTIFAGFCVLAFGAYEIGFRLGGLAKRKSPDEKDSQTVMLVGSIVGLLAFLLAVTMSMATDRFDTRRSLVRDEANAIGTTFLRAEYLAEPYSGTIKNLLREYVGVRIAPSDSRLLEASYARSRALHAQMWEQTVAMVRETSDSPVKALFVSSLNELIDLHTTRMTARLYARIPETVIVVLLIGAVLTIGVVGYTAGLSTRGSIVTTLMLIVALGAVITIVIDLDRPRDGFLQVSQQPLIDLRGDLGEPLP